MNTYLRIARLELNVLFFSPIAWIILIIFAVQIGVTFSDILEAREASQQLGNQFKGLTMSVFGGPDGFFASLQNKLYLYIPLLTMGLMSRELSSGSIKLLQSSPITNSQIVLGKFLAMVVYGFLLMILTLIVIVVSFYSIEYIDVKYLLGGVFGLFILICAYASIGLLMSSLTSYQVVAAISTLAVLATLSYIGTVGQSIEWVRDITYWISIEGRADNFLNGLISSKDVIYFILVIVLFLSLTVMRLNSGRKTYATGINAVRYVGLILGVLLIGYISSLPKLNHYLDTTRFKEKTLTDQSIALIDSLEEPLEVTSYVNVLNYFAHLGAPKFRIFDLKQFEQYTRYMPEMKMKYVAYYDSTFTSRDNSNETLKEKAEKYATAYGYDFVEILSPDEIRNEINLKPEGNVFVRKVSYKDKSTFLRMYLDMYVYPHEAEISAAIKRLLYTPTVLGFLSNNDERRIDLVGDKHYESAVNAINSRGSLVNKGFTVKSINQVSQISKDPELTVLVIADPITPFTSDELQDIKKFISTGGNIFIAGEPSKQELLNPILKEIGISFAPGTLLQQTDDFELDLIQSSLSKEASFLNLPFKNEDVVALSGAVGIRTDSVVPGFKLTELLTTNSHEVWRETNLFNLEEDSLFLDKSVQRSNELPVGVALERNVDGKNQRIVVMGDADFMSNAELRRFNIQTKNYDCIMKIFQWLSNGQFPIDVSRPSPIDNTILVSQKQIGWISKLLILIIPLSIGILGGVTLLRRKQK
ncbi:DUF4350 domain-containing protein [Imtechella halotolerans]|uniref:ABC transporter n=1 Tax=Imtechella halotolerans K1 TaxID=946077 RepID=I0WJB9_9FLAO|nr:DUF4350 domain-containing protein [Imtechella halotolerans]EID76485.1 ABC transporter [Imtechella halotolerans K1]WMQ62943.1 Gldg family protein [Imtechella halotolerans]